MSMSNARHMHPANRRFPKFTSRRWRGCGRPIQNLTLVAAAQAAGPPEDEGAGWLFLSIIAVNHSEISTTHTRGSRSRNG
jgi:hypothetical protein